MEFNAKIGECLNTRFIFPFLFFKPHLWPKQSLGSLANAVLSACEGGRYNLSLHNWASHDLQTHTLNWILQINTHLLPFINGAVKKGLCFTPYLPPLVRINEWKEAERARNIHPTISVLKGSVSFIDMVSLSLYNGFKVLPGEFKRYAWCMLTF